ncbi:MAG: PAS domain-containing protein, partial [Syntrophomonadaceae bacterium]|nr:PAS domain-containing protein [Syntrophomonadaceae bacterium]
SGRLVKVPGGLYELTFGEIPAAACMELERLLGGANLHIMGMTRGGRLFGSVTLMLPAGVSVENQSVIEAFVAQAAVGLQYRWAQEQLQQVNRELERKVEERTARLQAANRVLQAEVERHRRTAEALAASRERYRAFVERLSLGVFTCSCDEQATLHECNQALADILGFGSPEELVGRGLAALCVYPGECQAMRAALQAEGQVRNRDIQLCRRDGTALWVTVSARLIDDANGGERHVEGVLEDISARQQMEEQLRLSEERFRMAARCTTDVIYQLDMVTGAMEWFGDIDGVLGYGPGESPRTMEDWNRAIHPDDREAVVRAVEQHVARGTPYRCEYRVQRKDGSYRYWLDRGGIIRDHRGTTYTWIGAGTDITERRVAEASLRASEERFRTLADNIAEGIYLVDAGLQPLFYNPAIETIFGRPSSFFMEDHPRAFLSCVHPEDVEKVTEAFFAADPGSSREVTYRIVRPDGEVRYLRDVMRVVRDQSGGIRAYQGLISDITEQHLAEERLRYLSRYDALTGLYNRGYFEAEMRRLQQEQPVPLGMVVCDVDGLKLVNDTLGHEAGDNLLVAAAGVVLDCLDDRATVARIGGDEFAVVLPAADEEEVARRCRDIRQAVDRYNARNPELPLSISLGYA